MTYRQQQVADRAARICLLRPELSPIGADCAAIFQALRDCAIDSGCRITEAQAGPSTIRIRNASGETCIPAPPGQILEGVDTKQAAYRVLEWLRHEAFDLVCVPAFAGLACYVLAARQQGLACTGTTFGVVADRLTLLTLHRVSEMPHDIKDLVQHEMERRVLALADLTWFPDPAAEAWVANQCWTVRRAISATGTPEPAAKAAAFWRDLIALAQQSRAAVPTGAEPIETPLVSVCIPHFNRPALLRQAIESIRNQTYPNVEIVVVDDASTDPAAQAALGGIAHELAQWGGQLVRHETNRYLGAARNTGARHARGDFVLFLDDDDYARPEHVATLMQAMRATGADIVNSFCDRLYGDQPPQSGQVSETRCLFVGNAPAVGLFQNQFGTASALFRKTSLQQLGGYTELHGVGYEDWEIFARASLAGMNLQTVPLALYWYRTTPGSMLQTDSAYAGANRVLDVYLGQVPSVLWPVIRFARGGEVQLRETERWLQQRETAITDREADIAHLTRLNRENSERLRLVSSELSELQAVCRILLGGYGETPQAAVDSVLRSRSWRIGRLPQLLWRRLGGMPAEAPPRVQDWVQAAAVLSTLQRSSAWELTGPLRALARLIRRR